MANSIRILGLLLAMPLLCLGCASSPAFDRPVIDSEPSAAIEREAPPALEQSRAIESTATRDRQVDTSRPVSSQSDVLAEMPGKRQPDSEQLLQVISELQAVGAMDQAAQQQLLADLKNTDPRLWPQLLEYFRQSLEARQAGTSVPEGRAAVEVPAAETTSAAQALATDLTEVSRPKTATQPSRSPEAASPQDPAIAKSDQRSNQAVAPASHFAEPAPVGDVPSRSPGPQAASPEDDIPTAEQLQLDATASPQPSSSAADAQRLAAASGEPHDWRYHLDKAIEGLEQETASPPATTDAINHHAALRMLYLVARRRDEALRPIVGIPPTQQDFWSKEIYGLASYLDAERNPDASRRAAEAAVHLRAANVRLGEIATLHVKNAAFCSEVKSFGVYQEFDKFEFRPGQEVLVYAEVENFKSEATERGFHTALRRSYQILDPSGARVDEKEYPITEEHCQNPRQDFFVCFPIWMPKRVYGGRYTLQLTIEDTKSQKIGQASLEFSIQEN